MSDGRRKVSLNGLFILDHWILLRFVSSFLLSFKSKDFSDCSMIRNYCSGLPSSIRDMTLLRLSQKCPALTGSQPEKTVLTSAMRKLGSGPMLIIQRIHTLFRLQKTTQKMEPVFVQKVNAYSIIL